VEDVAEEKKRKSQTISLLSQLAKLLHSVQSVFMLRQYHKLLVRHQHRLAVVVLLGLLFIQ
jgi:hypothetical protein